MQTIGIGELQKNTAILTNLKEALTIVDKRKNKKVAIIYPIKESSENIVDELAGSLSSHTNIKVDNLDEAISQAMEEALREKYGIFN